MTGTLSGILSDDSLLVAAAGAAMGAGWMMVVAGLMPADPAAGTAQGPPWWRRAAMRARRWGMDGADDADIAAGGPQAVWAVWRWPSAVAAGLLAWLLSGWPVAGLIVAAALVGLPVLLATSGAAARSIGRAEAIEEWTRRLADVLVVGTGLEQAVAATVRTCPALVERPVSDLAARLRARWPTERALRALADDLDDAAGDLVVAALILGSRRRGPGLAKVLVGVADSLADEVAMRRKVEAERAKPRTTAWAVTLITLGVLAVTAFNGTYLRPYGTPLGQVVLALLVAAYAAALGWMHSVGRGRRPPRLLAAVPAAQATPDRDEVAQ